MSRSFYFLLGAAFFTACATAEIVFPYKFYFVSPLVTWEEEGGKLLGDKPENDKALSECRPIDGTDKDGKPVKVQKCAVVFLDELARLVAEFKSDKQRIIDLERRCPNP